MTRPTPNIVLDGFTRYGVSRNVEAEDAKGRPVKIALVVIERDNGSLDTLAINEELIRFAGEGMIEAEVRRRANR